MPSAASRLLYRLAHRAAPAYVVGPSLTEATRYALAIASRNRSTILCPWHGDGEAVQNVASDCRDAIDAIATHQLDGHVSLKVPELGYDRGLVASLVETAASRNVRIHFDALQRDTAEKTLQLFESLRADFDNLGYTIPARWRRSLADAERLAELGVGVRVVKGQFPDTAGATTDTRRSFLAILEVLAAGNCDLGVATHDMQLARDALQLLTDRRAACELEQLYGLPMLTSVAAELSVGIRIYVPYGHAYLPYAVRQVRERPIIAWWLMRDAVLASWPALRRLTS